MNQDALKKAMAPLFPALALNSIVSCDTRRSVLDALDWVLITLFIFVTFSETSLLPSLYVWRETFRGFFFVTLSLWVALRALEAFYDSYYFQGLQTLLPEAGLSAAPPPVTFEAAEVLFRARRSHDMTRAFVASRLGRAALIRLGLTRDSLAEFFSARTHALSTADMEFAARDGQPLGLAHIVAELAERDSEFHKFLSRRHITPKDISRASEWVERVEMRRRRRERFWGRDGLGRIPGIGKDWAYGEAYTLERFAYELGGSGRMDGGEVAEYADEIRTLEGILARSGEANALIVSDESGGALDVIAGLNALIRRGTVLPPLEHKTIFVFDTNAFIAATKNKATFESEFLRLLNESLASGNIILVITDFPAFVGSAQGMGSDVLSLMDPYLASPDFQVIAVSPVGTFHERFEKDTKVTNRFETLLLKERDAAITLRRLQDATMEEEARGRVLFTYQSVVAVAEGAKRYLTGSSLTERARHFLSEVAAAALSKNKVLIERSDVLDVIEAKTGIPTGEVSGRERETLLNLEHLLHERIIGQDEAVKAIAGALRRARSEIANPDRPMGSFLFLGPTGVGKTETTKALAAAFFGKEESVIRFDMSEYRTEDALSRLIGSFEDGKAGVLSSRLRERSYGVLLLDEFEKTNKEVIDLFLQILDEGFFSDSSGHRVNARNLIIIATSNAGSDLIWQMLRGTDADRRGPHAEGKHPLDKDKIIAEIINRGIFKPELLNRFDGVILFHPLSKEHLRKIAGLMLKKLQKRLAEKGILLVVDEVLMNVVTTTGTDPEFGARPMNRAIQEKVEQVIAKKIIAGELPAGSRVELTEAELM